MKREMKSILSRQLVFLTFIFVFVAGAFGVVTVGLRQEIATSGAEARAMERRLTEIDRFISKHSGEIAIAMSPAQLEAQNHYFQLGLRAPQEDQVVRVNAETQIRFAEQRWRQLVEVPTETVSFFAPEYN